MAAFILYQMGRSTNQRQWLYGYFGETVVYDLLKGAVNQAAQDAKKTAIELIGKEAAVKHNNLFQDAHLALARQYLGYLNRLFFFANGSKSGDQGRWDELVILAGEE